MLFETYMPEGQVGNPTDHCQNLPGWSTVKQDSETKTVTRLLLSSTFVKDNTVFALTAKHVFDTNIDCRGSNRAWPGAVHFVCGQLLFLVARWPSHRSQPDRSLFVVHFILKSTQECTKPLVVLIWRRQTDHKV